MSNGATKTAKEDFNLKTPSDILSFIANDGLEKPQFINSKEWENNPNPKNKIMVDAYSFFAGSLFGYLAFFRGAKKWTIKSFKKNTQPDPRNSTMRDALMKALITTQGEDTNE